MPTQDDFKAMLGTVSFFEGCSENTLTEIAKIATEVDCEKGQIIYEPGDKADNVYILENGIVTFINKSGLEFINVQRVMKESMIFGWVALVPGHPHRLGTAQCLEDSKILSINGEALLGILEQDTKSGFLVMKRLCTLIASTFVEKP